MNKMGVFLETKEARLPRRVHDGDAGFDLYVSKTVVVHPGEFVDIPHDIRLSLPEGYFARITGRSSALRRWGLQVAEGIIDNGYTGLLFTGVYYPVRARLPAWLYRVLSRLSKKFSQDPVVLRPGDRVSQLLIHRLESIEVTIIDEPPVSRDGRGDGGFGHTGR